MRNACLKLDTASKACSSRGRREMSVRIWCLNNHKSNFCACILMPWVPDVSFLEAIEQTALPWTKLLVQNDHLNSLIFLQNFPGNQTPILSPPVTLLTEALQFTETGLANDKALSGASVPQPLGPILGAQEERMRQVSFSGGYLYSCKPFSLCQTSSTPYPTKKPEAALTLEQKTTRLFSRVLYRRAHKQYPSISIFNSKLSMSTAVPFMMNKSD